MKKILFGIIIGIAISVPTTIFANDVVSVIGKKIDKEVNVLFLGKKLEKKAPLVDGTTYVPIREIAERLSFAVEFINGEVIIKSPNEEQIKIIVAINQHKLDIQEIKKNIMNNEQMIKEMEQGKIFNSLSPQEKQIEIRKEVSAEWGNKLKELEKELSELESQHLPQ
jgi:hypothetical protein